MAGRAKTPRTKPAPIVIERHLNSKHQHVLVGATCWCHPQAEETRGTLVVIHNDIPAMAPEGQ